MIAPPTLPSEYEVIIVGGGLSGLVAAYKIKRKSPNLRFCILEGQDRCGGQIAAENDYDLGARWISSEQHHVVSLCDELKLQYTTKAGGNDLHSRRLWGSDSSFGSGIAKYELGRFFRYIDALCQEYDPSKFSDDISKGQSMEFVLWRSLLFPASRNIVRLIIRSTCGLEAKHVSFTDYMVVCYGTNGITNQLNSLIGSGDQLLIQPNFQAIVYALLSFIEPDHVIRASKVTGIEHLRNTVLLTCSNQRKYSCEIVIIAVPLQALHQIKFGPELPQIYLPVNVRQPNLTTSFVCTFDGSKLDPPESAVWNNQVVCPMNENKFVGLCFTKSPKSDDSLLRDRMLARYIQTNLDCDALRTSIKWYERTWTPNVVVGLPTNVKWRRVIWAGTNAGTLYRGYCNGAVQSGLLAAIQALKFVSPGTVGWADTRAVLQADVVERRRVGFVRRQMMSLNVLNSLFFLFVACPALGFGLHWIYRDWDTLKHHFHVRAFLQISF